MFSKYCKNAKPQGGGGGEGEGWDPSTINPLVPQVWGVSLWYVRGLVRRERVYSRGVYCHSSSITSDCLPRFFSLQIISEATAS